MAKKKQNLFQQAPAPAQLPPPVVIQPSIQPASPAMTEGSLQSSSTFARFNERKQGTGWPGAQQQVRRASHLFIHLLDACMPHIINIY